MFTKSSMKISKGDKEKQTYLLRVIVFSAQVSIIQLEAKWGLNSNLRNPKQVIVTLLSAIVTFVFQSSTAYWLMVFLASIIFIIVFYVFGGERLSEL